MKWLEGGRMRRTHQYKVFDLISKVLFRIFHNITRVIVCKCIPINSEKILFVSKPSFSDNGKALYDYLLSQRKDKKFVWLINDDIRIDLPTNPKTTFILNQHQPFRAQYHVLTSSIIFFTHDSPSGVIGKRNGQKVINLWHGCGYKDSIKREKSWMERKKCDYSLVPGPIFVDTKSKAWDCDREKIWAIGYPRYDLLIREQNKAKTFIENRRRDNKKIVFWMPTFRNSTAGDYPEAQIKADYDLLPLSSDIQLSELNKFCKENLIYIIVKRHPSQNVYSCESLRFSNIEFMNNDDLNTEGVDLYSLLHYSDALISDYSSVSVDYMLLNRPIAYCLTDYEDYQDKRGFVFKNPLEYMPGNHIYSFEDLMEFLVSVAKGNDLYATDRERLMPVMHNRCYDYCKRIMEYIGAITDGQTSSDS